MKVTIQSKPTLYRPTESPQKEGKPCYSSVPIEKPKVDETRSVVPYTGRTPSVVPKPLLKRVVSTQSGQIQDTKPKKKFAIAPHETTTFHIKPVLSTQNDKVSLFIDSFAKQFKEIFRMYEQFKWDHKGFHLPEQDKVFFETTITNKSFNQYITTNRHLKDYVKQQVEFTWFKAPVTEKKENIFDVTNHVQGYEFKLERTSGLALAGVKGYVEKPLRDYLELSRTLLKDEKVFIQFGFKPADPLWYKDAESSINELDKRVRPKDISKQKTGFAGFECCLRVIVSSPDKTRLETLGRSYNMSIQQLNGDNKLQAKKIQPKKFNTWFSKWVLQRGIRSSFRFKNKFILTQKEMENFMKLPQKTLQKEFQIKVNEREELSIPKELTTGKGLPIGHAMNGSKKVPISLPFNPQSGKSLDQFMKTYIFQGIPGSGKDSSMASFLIEAAKLGCGAVVPDTVCESGDDRGLSDTITNALPKDQVITVDFADEEYPIYFGFDDLIEMKGNSPRAIAQFAEDLTSVLGFEKEYASKELCRLVARACRCNLYDMLCFLRSEKFAYKKYEEILLEDELLAKQVYYEYIKRKVPMNIAGAIKSRLDQIVGSGVLRDMFAQDPSKRFDLKKFLDQGKVVIIRMKKEDIGEEAVKILMYLLALKVFLMKKNLAHDVPTFMVFNEPHQFASDKLYEIMEKMIVESRKYRLGFLYAFHHHSYVKPIWDKIQSASMNLFLFKNTNYGIYREMQEQLKPIDIDTAMKTEIYESILLPFVEGKTLDPVFVKMLPPAKWRYSRKNDFGEEVGEWYDNSDLTKHHNIMYGTPQNLVYNKIKERELGMYEELNEKEEEVG